MDISSSLVDLNRSMAGMLARGEAFALATILKTEGSAPRKAGVKAIINACGAIQGTIGGGQVEAEARRLAVESIATGLPQVFEFRLLGEGLASGEPICGGYMRVLVDPNPGRHSAVFSAAANALTRRDRGLLITTIGKEPDWRTSVEFFSEQAIPSRFPGEAGFRSALQKEEAILFIQESSLDREQSEVLVEPLIPKPRLLIAGGGHVGQAVAALASLAGFDLIVVEDRPEYAKANLFPEDAIVRCGSLSSEIGAMPFGGDDYIVIVTRGHHLDAEALAACIHKPAAFIGMIGSRRKVAVLRKDFIDSGRATPEEFDRVHAPVGLDIGAVTVPEIALSIVAQLISIRRLKKTFHRDTGS